MPERPTEQQMTFPELEIIFNVLGKYPVAVTLEWDWKKTGEVHLSYATEESLTEAQKALQFASNFIADELWMLGERRKGDIPF